LVSGRSIIGAPSPPQGEHLERDPIKQYMETRFRKKQSRVLDFLYFRAGVYFLFFSFEWQRLTNDPGEAIAIGSHQRNRLEILF
jgi:hypothetical protein